MTLYTWQIVDLEESKQTPWPRYLPALDAVSSLLPRSNPKLRLLGVLDRAERSRLSRNSGTMLGLQRPMRAKHPSLKVRWRISQQLDHLDRDEIRPFREAAQVGKTEVEGD